MLVASVLCLALSWYLQQLVALSVFYICFFLSGLSAILAEADLTLFEDRALRACSCILVLIHGRRLSVFKVYL